MFILQSHYQTEGNFTFDNLDAAKNRRHHWRTVAALRHQIHATLLDGANHEPSYAAIRAMLEAINNNLNTPEVLRLVDELFTELANITPDDIDRTALLEVLQTIDELLGLQLIDTTPDIGDDTKKLIIERQRARDDKDWAQSDVLRDELLQQGIVVRDTPHGTIWQYT
jgi:cysteinyl-tRNA synthetase